MGLTLSDPEVICAKKSINLYLNQHLATDITLLRKSAIVGYIDETPDGHGRLASHASTDIVLLLPATSFFVLADYEDIRHVESPASRTSILMTRTCAQRRGSQSEMRIYLSTPFSTEMSRPDIS